MRSRDMYKEKQSTYAQIQQANGAAQQVMDRKRNLRSKQENCKIQYKPRAT